MNANTNYVTKEFLFNDQQVRTVVRDGEPWFVGKDVAKILGYTNPSKALADHVDSEDKLNNVSLSSLSSSSTWSIKALLELE